jgi:type IV secretory pathway VirB2 component (pilin)
MQTIKPTNPHTDAKAMYGYAALGMMSFAFLSLMAPDANAIGVVMCNWIRSEMFTGSLGKAIATIGVLIVAVGAALGKVSWTMAVTVACGIAAMFGARAIAGSFGGGCP